MNALEKIIAEKIKESGGMSLAEFMDMALCHPEHGYYMTRDPFGREGDFTTAPEISQMFGEMIGIWMADLWMQMGSPKKLMVIECGPGRGTLMADALRGTINVPDFHAALEIHLVEASPVLVEKQKETLRNWNVTWHKTLPGNKDSIPAIIIGNEFLDALPIRQTKRTEEGIQERIVQLTENGKFEYGWKPVEGAECEDKHMTLHKTYEDSPVQDEFIEDCAAIMGNNGAALFIDYGYTETSWGDTLQAVYKHEYSNSLENIGEADLTAHVDFQRVAEQARKSACIVHGPIPQASYLNALGISHRAQALINTIETSTTPEDEKRKKTDELKSSLFRLVSSEQMGKLFKVICVTKNKNLNPAGF